MHYPYAEALTADRLLFDLTLGGRAQKLIFWHRLELVQERAIGAWSLQPLLVDVSID